jgi:hypothetical protein
MPYSQQAAIRALFHELLLEGPVVPPVADATALDAGAALPLVQAFAEQGEPAAVPSLTPGWVGVPCAGVEPAIWMMRALAASNVLARREETTLLVPVNQAVDPGGVLVAARVTRVQALARHAGRA